MTESREERQRNCVRNVRADEPLAAQSHWIEVDEHDCTDCASPY